MNECRHASCGGFPSSSSQYCFAGVCFFSWSRSRQLRRCVALFRRCHPLLVFHYTSVHAACVFGTVSSTYQFRTWVFLDVVLVHLCGKFRAHVIGVVRNGVASGLQLDAVSGFSCGFWTTGASSVYGIPSKTPSGSIVWTTGADSLVSSVVRGQCSLEVRLLCSSLSRREDSLWDASRVWMVTPMRALVLCACGCRTPPRGSEFSYTIKGEGPSGHFRGACRRSAKVCKTTGAGQTPGPFLVSRHPPPSPAAGRQRVFSWVASLRVVKSHLGSPDVVCHCGGTWDRGLFAPQSTYPGSSWRQGSHMPYTSTGLLR